MRVVQMVMPWGPLTSTELANVFGCSPHRINAWRRKGMPARRIGKKWRYDYEEVKEWYDAMTKEGKIHDVESGVISPVPGGFV